MAADAELYEQDFVAWTRQQAARIKAIADAHGNLPIDWVNVAGEIEDLGKSDRRELGSRLETIIEHLLKLQYSPAQDPRSGWAADTVLRERNQVEGLLEQSPSLRSEVDKLSPRAQRRATKLVRRALGRHGEVVAGEAVPFGLRDLTFDEVLGDWLP